MKEKNHVFTTPTAQELGVGDAVFRPILLREHFRLLLQYRILFLAVFLSVTLGGVIYSYSTAPSYEGNILVQVTDLKSGEQRNVLGVPLSSSERRTAISEAEILRSRTVLFPVVDRLRLDLVVDRKSSKLMSLSTLGISTANSSVLDGAKNSKLENRDVDIALFEVPESLLSADFLLSRISATEFGLRETVNDINVVGNYGKNIVVPTHYGTLKIRVNSISGQEASTFSLKKMPRVIAMENLRAALTVAELGKDSGIVRVTYTDTSPKRISLVLNELSNSYMGSIRSQKSADVQRSIDLLKGQIPVLRTRVERAEENLSNFRQVHQTSDYAEETKARLTRYSASKARLDELTEKKAELNVRLGNQHPLLVGISQQVSLAKAEVESLSSQLRKSPLIAAEIDRRARIVQSEGQILSSVLNRIDELSVVAHDETSNVRIIDAAEEPAQPKGSRTTLILFFMVLGVFLGVFAVFLHGYIKGKFAVGASSKKSD